MFGETYRTGIFAHEGLAGIGANNVLLKMISDMGAYQRQENLQLRYDLVPLYAGLAHQLDQTAVDLARYPRTRQWDPSMLVGVAAYWAGHAHARRAADAFSSYVLPAQHMQRMSENIQLSLANRCNSDEIRAMHHYLTNICVAANLLPRELRLSRERYSTPDPFRRVYETSRHAA